jgi:hypothetical protein
MGVTDLVINIASQFTGKSAFEKADKSTKLLTKNVKNLGKVIGVAFSATAILAYSKKSIKAAADDMKAQKLLAQSLKNVGLAYATVNVENFIGQLEKQTGILDDQLRPAFSKLAQVTGSVTKTQSLLKLAFDVSSGSGLDYSSTVDILAKAYLNNNKGLSKLSLGLTQAEIEAMDFADVVELLTKRFDGAGAAAVDSYSGSMAILATSSANAAEIIGTSLIGAIETLGGNDGIKNLGTDIENAAKSTANLIDEMAFLSTQIGSIPVAGGLLSTFGRGIIKILGDLSPQRLAELTREIQAGRGMNAAPQASKPYTPFITDEQRKAVALAKAAELAAIKRNKELAKLAKDRAKRETDILKQKKLQAKLDKAALALGKGENVFDLDKIQIAAAILATQENIQRLGVNATDQQKLQLANDAQRLTVKQLMLDLEDAIAAKDVERATSLSKQLNTELAILGTLTGQTYKLGQIDKILASFVPKDLINLDNLDAAIRKLLEIAGSRFDFLSPIMPSQDRSNINNLDQDILTRYNAGDPEAVRAVEAHADAIGMLAESELALADALLEESIRALDIATASLSPSVATSSRGFDPAAFRMADNITINVNAGVIGSEDSVEQAVQKAILSIERKGDPLRYTGGL